MEETVAVSVSSRAREVSAIIAFVRIHSGMWNMKIPMMDPSREHLWIGNDAPIVAPWEGGDGWDGKTVIPSGESGYSAKTAEGAKAPERANMSKSVVTKVALMMTEGADAVNAMVLDP